MAAGVLYTNATTGGNMPISRMTPEHRRALTEECPVDPPEQGGKARAVR